MGEQEWKKIKVIYVCVCGVRQFNETLGGLTMDVICFDVEHRHHADNPSCNYISRILQLSQTFRVLILK